MARNPSHTKTGPGRLHAQGDGKRRPKFPYGRGLENHFERMRKEAYEARAAKRAAR